MRKTQFDTQDTGLQIGKLDTNGFLKVTLKIGKVGVLPYTAAEIEGFEDLPRAEAVWVLRDEYDLFSEKSKASVEGIPILAFGHAWALPGEQEALKFEKEEWRGSRESVLVGAVGAKAQRSGDFLITKGLITNIEAIKAIQEKRLSEISPAFSRTVEIRKGTWQDIEYDAIFHDIEYNHIALLPPHTARGGKELNITTDIRSEEMEKNLIEVITTAGKVATDSEGARVMDQIKRSLDDAIGIQGELKELKEKMVKLESIEKELAEVKAERDTFKISLDEATKEIEVLTTPETIMAEVNRFVEIQEEVKKIASMDELPEGWKNLPIPELKKQAIIEHYKKRGVNFDTTSDDFKREEYVNGLWCGLKNHVENKKGVPASGAVDAASVKKITPDRSIAMTFGYKNV